jgi:predicted esterase
MLHLSAVAVLLLVAVGALALATWRGDAARAVARLTAGASFDLSALLPAMGHDPVSSLVALPALPALPMTDAPRAAPFRAFETAEFTSWTASPDYTPDAAQGTRHVTANGTVWWCHGPSGGDPRPVVILLHGAGRTGHSMVDMWHETAERHGLVLVAPDFDAVDGWSGGDPDPRAAMDALAHAATLHPVDMDRVVLFGHSRGGIAAQAWANRWNGPWRAAAAHAGTLPAGMVRTVSDGVPVRHYLGSYDLTFPFGPGEESARAMAAAGHPFDLVRLDQHTHWFYETGEDIAEDAWGWFAAHLR